MNRAILTVRKDGPNGEIIEEHLIVVDTIPQKFETLLFNDVAYTVLELVHVASEQAQLDQPQEYRGNPPITAIHAIVKQ